MFRSTTPHQPNRTRLAVEQLEDRQLLSGGPTPLTFHQGTYVAGVANPDYPWGTVIQHVQVENVFWGSPYATTKQGQSTVKYMNKFMKYLVGSPFMDVLAQYGNVGHGTFKGSYVLHGVPTTGTSSASTIQAALQQQIDSHHLPPWSSTTLFMVYMPPGVSIGFPGTHANRYIYGSGFFHDYLFAAVESAPTALTNTYVASHELAETVTDPRVGAGWYNNDAWNAGRGGEVADLAVGIPVQLNGYKVTQLYSNAAGGLVSP
jgi:hypothetical protein